MDVKVLPLLGGSLSTTDKILLFLLLFFEVFELDILLFHVTLGEDEEDKSFFFFRDSCDLINPFLDISQRILAIGSDAKHKQVGFLIHNFSIGGQVLVSTSIVQL